MLLSPDQNSRSSWGGLKVLLSRHCIAAWVNFEVGRRTWIHYYRSGYSGGPTRRLPATGPAEGTRCSSGVVGRNPGFQVSPMAC